MIERKQKFIQVGTHFLVIPLLIGNTCTIYQCDKSILSPDHPHRLGDRFSTDDTEPYTLSSPSTGSRVSFTLCWNSESSHEAPN